MKVYVLIQARSNSNRLPFKIILNINNYFVTELLYRRVKSKSYETVVLTSDNPTDDFFCYLLEKKKIPFVRGDLKNVKKRFINFKKNLSKDDIIVRLTSDNVFIDKLLIKSLLKKFLKLKKKYIFLNNKFVSLPYGLSVEIFKYSFLKYSKNNSQKDIEHVTYSFPKERKNSFIINPTKKRWLKLNCSIDYLNDYKKIKKIFEEIPNSLNVRWDTLCDKLKGKRVKNGFDIKFFSSNSTKIKKKIRIKLSSFVNKKKNYVEFKGNEYNGEKFHNFLTLNKKLIGYFSYIKTKNSLRRNYLVVDSLIILDRYKNTYFSNILMYYLNNKILNINLPCYLTCKSQMSKYFGGFGWKIKHNQLKNLNTKNNLSLMTFNI